MRPGTRCPRVARLLAAAALCAPLGACFHVHSDRPHGHPDVHTSHDDGGPPPWAPAHGHRRKHDAHGHHDDGRVEVVFDSGRGVHVVVGFPHHYYDAGHYYRVAAGRWEVSAVFAGPWVEIETERVPVPLRHAHQKPEKKKKKRGKPARWAPYWD